MLPVVPVIVCAACAAASALCVVLLRRPVHVAISLLAHSLALAALYMTMSATFSAVAQTLIYSGAIVVLFLIVVALLPTGGAEQLRAGLYASAGVVFLCVGAVMAAVLSHTGALPAVDGAPPTVKEVGAPLFAALIEPFELTAPLLLAAIVTAISLWRRTERRLPRARAQTGVGGGQ